MIKFMDAVIGKQNVLDCDKFRIAYSHLSDQSIKKDNS